MTLCQFQRSDPSPQFSDEVGFGYTQFSGKTDFSMATFPARSDFQNALFSDMANFDMARFSNEANFNLVQFSDEASFVSVEFSGRADFRRTQFSAKADFGDAPFSNEANFDLATFSGKASFYRTTFSGKASFHRATFSEEASFSSATFLKEADFSSSNFKSNSNFKLALFDDKIIFVDVTGFSKMSIKWEYGSGKFRVDKDLKKIKLRGLSEQLKYNEAFYIALIKNYSDMGMFKEADDAFYTYRVKSRKRKPLWIGTPERAFLDSTFGYGVKPWILLRTFLLFWIPFSFYYLGFIRIDSSQKLPWWQAWNPFHKMKRILWSLIFSFDTLTPGISFEPMTTLSPLVLAEPDSKRLIYVKRFQQVLGWYLLALFLILFSRVWIR